MKKFALRGDLYFYDNSARSELRNELEKIGFKYTEPQMGGGGGVEIKEITIVFFTIKEFWAGIFLGVISNAIYDLIKNIYKWHKSKKVKKTDYIPNVCITIYPHILSKKSFTIFIRIDKEPSEEEIIKEIKKAKRHNFPS